MIRWIESDANRLHPQEQALLALFDRMTILEQAFTAEIDKHRAARARLDHVQKELARTQSTLAKLEREHLALVQRTGRG